MAKCSFCGKIFRPTESIKKLTIKEGYVRKKGDLLFPDFGETIAYICKDCLPHIDIRRVEYDSVRLS